MNLIDTVSIRRFHEAHIREHGQETTGALGWKNFYSQQARFAMLEGIGDMNNCSLLDVGCGHGDLRAYLDDLYPKMRYIGIDFMDEFLSEAIERYGHLPETAFFYGDYFTAELPHTDYVLASGSLNYHSSDPDFIYSAIAKLFATCRIALGFNLLSKVDAPGGILVAYDAKIILNYCKTLSDKVILHEGYADDDFTVWMYSRK